MPTPISSAPRKNWMTAINEDNGAGLRESVQVTLPTIPTAAGTVSGYVLAPEDGYLHSIHFSGVEALVASDTNFITFTVTNLKKDGLGVVQMLASVPENTTKLTGGSALTGNQVKALKLSQTANILKVEAGDKLKINIMTTGTLPNAVNGGIMVVRFNP